jgi:hypothetical protein
MRILPVKRRRVFSRYRFSLPVQRYPSFRPTTFMCYVLRTVAACLCLEICLFFSILWAASYSTGIQINGKLPWQRWFTMWSAEGGLYLGCSATLEDQPKPEWVLNQNPYSTWEKLRRFTQQHRTTSSFMGYSLWHHPDRFGMTCPHWLPVLMTGAIAVLLRPKPRLNFGTRDMLLLTSVVAMTLGVVSAWIRYTSP